MQRIQTAFQQNRGVFILGEGLVGSTAEAEMVRKGFSGVSLDDSISEHTVAFSPEALAPALQNQGIIVLVEPSFDEANLEALSTLISSQNPRPQLFIIAKFYNRFSMPMHMMNFKMNHIKQNALNFFRGLVEVEIQEVATKSIKSSRAGMSFEFIGRETDVASLTESLNTVGKPVCLKGVEGIGKRSLVEHVIEAHDWKRVPDLHLSNYLNGDALLGRMAHLFAEVGNDALLKGLSGKKRISIQQTLTLLTEGLQIEGLTNYCFVVSGIHNRLNNRKQFHSVGLTEMILEQIWKTDTALKLVFMSTQLPASASSMRTIPLKGFSPEESDAFLKMQQVPEFSEDEFTQIMSRTKGHPLALRFLAVKTRQEGNYGLLSDERFALMSNAQDFRQIRKMFQKLTNKLDADESAALKTIAVFNAPVQAQYLTNLGINRKLRTALLGKGVLEQTPSSKNRRYYAHELTHSVYRSEDIYNYDTMENLAERQMDLSKDNSTKFNKTNPNRLFE